jgi:pimeloyl-ACP methyl ester carboxylesterase
MPLVDRANNILALLLAEARLNDGEISFVVHSFGGLIVEQLLRTASERSTSEPSVADFVRRVRRVSFLGTPHRGADLATWARIGRIFSRPSSAAEGLGRNDPNLNDLNQWYRRFAPENGIATQTLTESRRTWYGQIVKPDSADPGLPSTPIPVDADHYGIAAPPSRSSAVYILVRDFLKTPVPAGPRKVLIGDETLDAIANDAKQNTAALGRIEQKLAASATTPVVQPSIPSFLIDSETQKRVLRLRKGRLIPLPNLHQEVSKLVQDLTRGELAATSSAVKAAALAWCARLQFSMTDKSEAESTLQAAHGLARTDEVIIADAFAESYAKDYQSGLGILASVNTPAGRATSFILVANNTTPSEALDWFRRASITLADIDADGKFFVLKKQLEARNWQDALSTANKLQPSDFDDAPGLLYLAGSAHLAQAVPEELITLILWALPFDLAVLPLAVESQQVVLREAEAADGRFGF